MALIGRLGNTAIDLFFPRHCKSCHSTLEYGLNDFCLVCAQRLETQRQAASCPYCAASVAPFEVSEGRCAKCRRSRFPTRGTVRVAAYAKDFELLLRSYKYHDREDLGPVLAEWLAESICDTQWFQHVEAIVCVPTHWKRKFGRSFHAAHDIAKSVAKIVDLPFVPVLRRLRAGPHQIGLNQAERVKNVSGAFALRRGVKLHDARLLLIDDVRTTGATLNECAKVLRHSGAAEVYAAVLARAGWDGDKSTPIKMI